MEITNNLTQAVSEYIDRYTDPAVYKRGLNYYKEKRVIGWDIQSDPDTLHLLVDGTERYDVDIHFEDESLFDIASTNCNCVAALNGVCKHQVAALFWYADNHEEVHDEAFDADMDEDDLIDTMPRPAPQKIAAPVARGPGIRRLASEPFTIANYKQGVAHLKPNDLADQVYADHDPGSLFPGILAKDAIETYFDGEITDVKALSSDKHFVTFKMKRKKKPYVQSGLDESFITLKFHNEALVVSCSCRMPVNGLCGHAYHMLQHAHTSGLLASLAPFSQTEADALGNEEMRKYGFDPSKGWQEYFDLHDSKQGRVLKPKPAYAKYVAPSGFSPELLGLFGKSDPGKELKKLGAVNEPDMRQVYEVGFVFDFGDESRRNPMQVEPIFGKYSAKGEPMSVGFRDRHGLGYRTEVQYGPHDLHILHTLDQSELGRGYSHYSITSAAGAFSRIAAKLEQHPYLYLSAREKYSSYKKSNLEPLRFTTELPPLCVRISEDANGIEAQILLAGKVSKLPVDALKINADNEHFILIDHTLHFIESSRIWHAAYIALQCHGMRFTPLAFGEVFNSLFQQLGKVFEITFENMKTLEVAPALEQKAQSSELYLSEVGNFVIFEPFIRYSEELLLPARHQPELWQLENAKLQRNKLDPQAGRNLMDALKSAHPTFAEQRRTDFFHLSYKELLEKDTALALFAKLREADIKIFGEKSLNRLKAIPKPAKVSYTVSSEIDWFEIDATFDFGDEMLTLAALKKRFVPGSNFVELGDGGRGLIPEAWLKKLERIFKSGEVDAEAVRVSAMHFNLIDELFDDLDEPDLQAFIAERRDKLLHFKGIETHPLPRGIKATLRPYQNDGFQWMCFLHEFGWGGILADDMGLGKTLQVITFLKHILRTNKQCNLVVVPTSLLFNWENELQKFAPAIKAIFHHGTGRSTDPKLLTKAQLVVTSYGTMLSDIDLLRHIEFNYVVLDESQAIKNTASKRYKAARLLKANNRLAMTGTPIENNTFDLYAQLSFLNPGLLGSAKHFKADFAKAIDTYRDSEKAALLQRMIKPFVLRRTKEQVATELPDKVEDVLYCELGAAQRKVYDAHRNEIRETLLGNMESEVVKSVQFAVLQGLTKLRQICDSPLLLPGKEKYLGGSEKIDLLLRHIREKTSNHKLLIFSQFVQMLKLIEGRIADEGIPYAYLDGQSTTKERQAAVETFQNNADCRVFLISLKAGGTGLNLMAADYVYIVDPWWNPAVENQAIDRCYRIGQDKKVIAYRLICKDTVEEKIQKLQARKKSIANDLITTDEGVMQKLTRDDLVELFA